MTAAEHAIAIAQADRTHVATCTCGWRAESATKPGARILADYHEAAKHPHHDHRTYVS